MAAYSAALMKANGIKNNGINNESNIVSMKIMANAMKAGVIYSESVMANE